MNIGYIGLGALGAPIAQWIERGGFALAVYDIVPGAMAPFGESVVKAASPREVALAADLLCACVRTDAEMIELTEDGSLFEALGQGPGERGTFMIHSTIAPELAQKLSLQAEPYGVAVLDCGVSRGGGAEVEGNLSIYVGGAATAVARARPLLDHLGSWRHFGPVGTGMTGKLLNNLVSIANYGMAAHILELGEQLGFDRAQLREMLMAGSAQGFAMKVAPGFVAPDRAANMLTLLGKDVAHARALADPGQPSLKALLAAAQSMLDLLAEQAKAQP